LLGGCCFGRPSQLPFAVHYDHALAPAAALPQPLHPVPLYEAVALLVLALVFALRPLPRRSGLRAAGYIALYAGLRVVLETLRGDTVRGVFGGVSSAQAIAVVLLGVAGFYLLRAAPPARRAAGIVALLAALAAAGALAASGRVAADVRRELTPSLPAIVHIEGGWFAMGSDEDDVAYAVRLCRGEGGPGAACGQEQFAHEHPRRRVFVSRYAIDRSEVDNEGYRRCVLAGACAPARTADHDARLGKPRQPIAGVTWREAQRYCRWVGGTLPSEAQWEYAARGASRRRFPWGRHYNSRVANHGPEEIAAGELDGYRFAAPVVALPDGRSAHVLFIMAGNVWELVADRYDGRAYERAERIDPLVEAGDPGQAELRVMRGGSWRSGAHELRVTQRAALPEHESRPDVGFRCAYNVP
jgi:formylglycine-generating enzyme required for sulfatase activity